MAPIKNYVWEKALCKPGQELTKVFYSAVLKKRMLQYDYRTPAGVLFSTVAPSLKVARARRDQWLQAKGLGGENA